MSIISKGEFERVGERERAESRRLESHCDRSNSGCANR